MLKKTASLVDVIATIRELIEHAKGFPVAADAFSIAAQRLCDYVECQKKSCYLIPKVAAGGLAIEAIIRHEPKDTKKNPPTKNPRQFDTLFFVSMILMEIAGMRMNFHRKHGEPLHYFLRGKFSDKPGDRIYLTRIILNASPGKRAQFEEHHSYRLLGLRERNGGGMLPDGELGRHAAIDRCCDNYAKRKTEHHAVLSPDAFRALLLEVFAAADMLHGHSPITKQ